MYLSIHPESPPLKDFMQLHASQKEKYARRKLKWF